jgi:gliding motility-associated-like protein
MINTVIYNTGTGNQVSLNGNRYNSNDIWFSNIGTVPSGPHAWTSLAPNHTGYVLRFIGFIDANANGQFNFGTDQYLGVINQSLTINPSVSGTLYMAFYDDGPYNDNSGILTFLLCPDTNYVSVVVCDEYTWPVNNQTYQQSGTYINQTVNTFGCDSVTVLDLIIYNSEVLTEEVSSCAEFIWPVNGQTYTSSGYYTEVLQTQFGCDSTVILDLTIYPALSSTETIIACNQYFWPVNSQTYTSSGTYTEVLQTQYGCDSTFILNLTILSGTASETNISACESYSWNGQTYALSGTYTYQTINGQGCDSTAVLNLTVFNSVQTQEVIWVCEEIEVGSEILNLSTVHGCDSIHTILYQLVPSSERPIASFSTSPNPVMLPPGIIQTVNTSQNANTYLWNFGDGSGTTTEPNLAHSYQNEGQYEITLIANNATNCPDTAQLQIIVQEDLLMYVPNAFTPDGDGFNNVFLPIINGDFDPYTYTLLIFNRWGELIFESRNAEIGWDGTYGGNMVSDGTYTWKISLKSGSIDERREFVGHVNLLR